MYLNYFYYISCAFLLIRVIKIQPSSRTPSNVQVRKTETGHDGRESNKVSHTHRDPHKKPRGQSIPFLAAMSPSGFPHLSFHGGTLLPPTERSGEGRRRRRQFIIFLICVGLEQGWRGGGEMNECQLLWPLLLGGGVRGLGSEAAERD